MSPPANNHRFNLRCGGCWRSRSPPPGWALSFVLFAAALQSVVALTGTGLAALAFIFVGNAISGGSIPIAFLPDGFRQLAPCLPNAAIVSGARDAVYFNGDHLVHSARRGVGPVMWRASLQTRRTALTV